MDDKRRIREWAYDLWEKEGRPTGRALDHWLEAERRERASGPAQQANEGEGNRTAAREVNGEAEAVLAGDERKSLKKAERTGRRRGRGEDPEVKR